MLARVTSDVRRNAFLLAGWLVCNSGMFQLAAALSSLTLVAVTGVKGILGLGPAIFLAVGRARRRPGRPADGPRRPHAGHPRRLRRRRASAAASIAGGCAAHVGVPRLPRPRARRRRPARSSSSRARRRPRCSRPSVVRAACRSSSSAPSPARSGGRSSSARSSRTARSTRTALVGPWLLGIPFMLAGLRDLVVRAARPEGDLRRAIRPTRGDAGDAPRRCARSSRRPGVPSAVARRRRELRRHGVA